MSLSTSHSGPAIAGLEAFCRLEVQVGMPATIDATPGGQRKSIPILGGSITGELVGEILPGGSDNVLIRADGCAEIDARYVIKLVDGTMIYVQDQGFRYGPAEIMQALQSGSDVDPADYYFRTRMLLQTGADKYLWLNSTLFIASSHRTPDAVLIDLYKVI